MRVLGFCSVPYGKDGPEAWRIAEQWNERWDKTRRGEEPSPARALTDKLSAADSEESEPGVLLTPPDTASETDDGA
jgi:hypothetical protein